jgi:hypothetical protein
MSWSIDQIHSSRIAVNVDCGGAGGTIDPIYFQWFCDERHFLRPVGLKTE